MFHDIVLKEWFESWPELQWLSSYFLKRLSDSIRCIPFDPEEERLDPVIRKLVHVLQELQSHLQNYGTKVIMQAFEDQETDIDESISGIVVVLGLIFIYSILIQ